jgi:hypothetical protein
MKVRRSIWLVNQRFQLRYMMYATCLAFALIAVFAEANAYFFWKIAATGHSVGLPEGHIFFTFLREQQKEMNKVFWIASGVTLVFVNAAGLFFTHKIAGPLYHFRKYMIAMGRGRTRGELKFRNGDEFPELARTYNRHLRAIGSREGRVREFKPRKVA